MPAAQTAGLFMAAAKMPHSAKRPRDPPSAGTVIAANPVAALAQAV